MCTYKVTSIMKARQPTIPPPPHTHIILQFPLEGTESEEKGRILLTISYSAQDNALTIGVGKALDLPAVDSSGLADPYVRWYDSCCNLLHGFYWV